MTDQGLVNCLYALGRLRINPNKVPLLGRTLSLLEDRAAGLETQHIANCLYAIAKLDLDGHQLSHLLFKRVAGHNISSSQTRPDGSTASSSSTSPPPPPRSSLALEPQQVSNIIATLPIFKNSRCAPACNVLMNLVSTEGSRFSAQLLSSIACNLAAVQHDLNRSRIIKTFQTIGHQIRIGERPGEHVSSDTLIAFTHARLFHEPLFSWALQDLLQRTNAPLELMCRAAQALLYTDHYFHDFERIDGITGKVRTSFVFPQASEEFQMLSESFLHQVGKLILHRSRHVYMESVQGVAQALQMHPVFASATLVPFDVLKHKETILEGDLSKLPSLNLPLGKEDNITTKGITVYEKVREKMHIPPNPTADILAIYLKETRSDAGDVILNGYSRTCDPSQWSFNDICTILSCIGVQQGSHRQLFQRLCQRAEECLHQFNVNPDVKDGPYTEGFWPRWGTVLHAVQGIPGAENLSKATAPLCSNIATNTVDAATLCTLCTIAPESEISKFVSLALNAALTESSAENQMLLLASLSRCFDAPPVELDKLGQQLIEKMEDSDTPWLTRNAVFDDAVTRVLLALIKNPSCLASSRNILLQALERHIAASGDSFSNTAILAEILHLSVGGASGEIQHKELIPLALRLMRQRLKLPEQVKVAGFLIQYLEYDENVVGEAIQLFLDKMIWQKKHLSTEESQHMKLLVSVLRFEFPNFFVKLQDSTKQTLVTM